VAEIDLVEVSGSVQRPTGAVTLPFGLEGPETVTLRFLLSASGDSSLDALREARRALLREEWTRGRDADEPSLEEAVFSATEILWVVLPSQRDWCLKKLEELRLRANRLLTLMGPTPSTS
jgi:hypothetical protein